MSRIQAIRNKMVDSPDSLAARYRLRRWEMLEATFPAISEMTVIDLGGRAEAWRRVPVRPAHVHVVNLEDPDPNPPSGVEVDRADACDLPTSIRARRYDLVFSNAVLEHVGGHARRRAFADSVHALAAHHWIQTPYRYFPVEPHWLFPLFQNLPVPARVYVSQRWPLSYGRSRNPAGVGDRQGNLRAVMDVELITRTELQAYFPSSRIVNERVGPLTKSIIAVR